MKDTLNKGHLCIKDTFQCTNLYCGNTFASKRGQPLYSGQEQRFRYLELPLYLSDIILFAHVFGQWERQYILMCVYK